jgi:hypothetical protein
MSNSIVSILLSTKASDIDLLLESSNADPTNGLVAEAFAEEFKLRCERRPDYNYVCKNETNAFLNWIKTYGVRIYDRENQ